MGERGELSPVLDGWSWVQGRRNVHLQQVGSYLEYTGRGVNAFGKAATDPQQSSPTPTYCYAVS